jgi:hypothetical protein
VSLKEIAKMMRQHAELDGVAEQTLSGGLILTLKRSGQVWVLTLKRSVTWPDAKEQAIIRGFFGVPRKTQGRKESAGGYRLIKLTWTDNDEQSATAEKPEQLKLL